MEAGSGGGSHRRRNLAAVSGAMPHARERRTRAVIGDFRARARSCPGARAGQSVRVPLPMVAAAGSGLRAGAQLWVASGHSGGRIHDGVAGARPLPIGHRCVGQYSIARLPLRWDPLLRAYQARRLYVRSRRAGGRESRSAQRAPGPFRIRRAADGVSRPLRGNLSGALNVDDLAPWDADGVGEQFQPLVHHFALWRARGGGHLEPDAVRLDA